MAKTQNRPEQLHLDLQWEYLSHMAKFAENPAHYEAVSQIFLQQPAKTILRSPLWDELVSSHR